MFVIHLSSFPSPTNHQLINLNQLEMYNYYKPQVKIKDGAATLDYKSLTQLALATPVPSPEGQKRHNELLQSKLHQA